MTDVQLHTLLSHIKARLDDAIEVAETTLPEDLMVQPEHLEVTKRIVPAMLLKPLEPYIPQLASLYQLQRALAADLEKLSAAVQPTKNARPSA